MVQIGGRREHSGKDVAPSAGPLWGRVAVQQTDEKGVDRSDQHPTEVPERDDGVCRVEASEPDGHRSDECKRCKHRRNADNGCAKSDISPFEERPVVLLVVGDLDTAHDRSRSA